MTEERTGEAFELDEQLTVVGRKLTVGDQAPAFALDSFDGENMLTIRLSDGDGRVRLINTVNSVDTPVCDVETRRWEGARKALPAEVVVYTVSMDLPFAQARWREATGTEHLLLTAHRDERFGRDYGVFLKEWRLLQRAVFVVGPEGRIAHVEYVADQMAEPDYDAVLESLML